MKITIDTDEDRDFDDESPLTLKQDKFCRLYTTEGDTFGNGSLAYALAYGYDLLGASREDETDENNRIIKDSSEWFKTNNTCGSSASRLLRNGKIVKRKNQLLVAGLNDEMVDAKLKEHIVKARADVSLNAIKHYADLKGRVIKKIDLTTKGNSLTGMSDAELEAMTNVPDEQTQ